MNLVYNKLTESLQTGFINQNTPSYIEYLPQLLVNDKKEGKKVLSTILQQLNTCEEFWFSVAFITTNGVATLIETLNDLEKRGIKGKILVSQYLNFTQPEALKRLLKFENLELKIAIEGAFHSKGYLFKRQDIYDLIIGSSNLTSTALCTNIEWNLKISATPISHIIFNAIKEFTSEFEKGINVDFSFIKNYEILYKKQLDFSKLLKDEVIISNQRGIIPNLMQLEALNNIEYLRSQNKNKALLISATGTGKTYLSAFDVKKVNPKKFLFVVHRLNIAKASMKAYKKIFGDDKSMGIYSGNNREIEADYIFSTIQTISKDEHLSLFNPSHFEYIVIDETHRAGADSYQKILQHFQPKYLLGMTATPERTDGLDVFKLFDYNIAYEIRLHKALEEEMLSPFHYYGVTDITVDGKVLDENADFNKLTSQERIDRIIDKANIYGCDNGRVRGLIFCSSIEESLKLSCGLNERGYNTISLSSNNTEFEREQAIKQLEAEEGENQIDYILTVDIFNEGIDIPSVNQIIMLRPTQSAIVFVQQLGRGLRKIDNKEYLTVIDFIGNYRNNYMVPIALYGDTSYNKDSLRKLMSTGSNLIPGTSTINFDQISRERIYQSINSASMTMLVDLKRDYQLLKFRLGRIPMMIDFMEHGSRDPFLYVNSKKSYFNFVLTVEDSLKEQLNDQQIKLLELFSNEINNSKRIEECIILKALLHSDNLNIEKFKLQIKNTYGYLISNETIDSCVNNLNFKFVTENRDGQLKSVHDLYNINVVELVEGQFTIAASFTKYLESNLFFQFLNDSIEYSIQVFNKLYKQKNYIGGFVLYRKYTRKDVFRILNWDRNPLAQNVGGYILSSDKSNCPIFVNYHKEEGISNTIKYEDGFINNSEFEWMTKSKRTLNSPDVRTIFNFQNGLRLPLFIKKHNDEGKEFYYMGDVTPVQSTFIQTTMLDDNGKQVPVVKLNFKMNIAVEDSIYYYLTNKLEYHLEKGEVTFSDTDVKESYPFKVLLEQDIKPYINCIPLYDITAAAGRFSNLQIPSIVDWIELKRTFKYSEEYFVCKIVGESMNRIIPSNSWCLFKHDTGGSRSGKIVLVNFKDIQDPDYAAGYTVKLYESKKEVKNDSWSHTAIILKPHSTDPDFKNIILNGEDLEGFKVVGIFIEVLS